MSDSSRVRVTVWSDYVCPFCYLEEPVLEQLRREYGGGVPRGAAHAGGVTSTAPWH